MILQKICPSKYLFGLLLLACLAILPAHTIGTHFKKLSYEEKSALQYFFDTAIKTHHLGHVLFFSTKPAALFVIDTTAKQNLFTMAWNVWKSQEHLFPHPNFIFYEEECENKIYVYCINKRTLLSQLSKKEESLKHLFGASFSIKSFVERLEHPTSHSLICMDPILSGILLGYGIESPLGFMQHIDPKSPTSSKELTGILCAAEGKIETSQLEDGVTLCTFKSKVPIHPVSFVGDPDSKEVQNLKKVYSKELEKIEALYQRKDLLQMCLKRLTNRAPSDI